MAKHLEDGNAAEAAAEEYLKQQGLALLARNFRCRYGEIDRIMQIQQEVVFVEVRFRASGSFGGAIESITQGKQTRLKNTAEYWLQKNSQHQQQGCRFDVITVTGQPPSYKIQWISDAFY